MTNATFKTLYMIIECSSFF